MPAMGDTENKPPEANIYTTEKRSRRRMTAGRRLLYQIIVPMGLGIIRFFWTTVRLTRVVGAEHLQAALTKSPSLIPCYWHQHQLFCAKFLLEQRRIGLRAGFLISPSVDGEIGAMLVARVHGHVIRGSSTHTGARALRDYYDALVKQQVSPVITPDGPRGPRFVFKPGAVLLAQMSGLPILPMAYFATRASLVKWDKFVIPWPGSRVVIAIGAPHYVPRTLNADGLAAQSAQLSATLKQLFELARASI